MKSSLLRIYKSRKSMIFFWIIILLPLIELSSFYITKIKWGTDYHPAISFFLSGSGGHIPQILLFWFLPIYFLIIYSDSYTQDVKYGYNCIEISKVGKKNYIRTKFLVSFFAPFIIMTLALGINLVLSYILFAGGTYSLGLFEMHFANDLLHNFSLNNPFLTCLIFLLNVSIFSGLAGTLGLSASLIFKEPKYTYPAAFFTWFVLIILNNSMMNVFQPFTEYGFHHVVSAEIRYLIILILIPFFSYFYWIKKDEL
ncbi:hypothetical protein [Priestia sp. J2]|uniref:hypothetical protein n=1 Tax=unclassified Priestia TaxID=2800374 RepID=UPI001E2DC118|nr:hypothetical protein [Priestia sp. J2]